jgi:predicted RNA-binding Zn-ribbon protein involved in translation (DUF1610 family)
MHPDIEKLINIARESGELTDKHKEIILRKAEKLGEDVDEVEMLLETIKPRKTATSSTVNKIEKRIKCPNCGAIISETSFQCPECGYTLQRENQSSEDARKVIDQLQAALLKASESHYKTEQLLNPYAPVHRQASVINTFTLPTTKEGLLQLLDFAYSNYVSLGTIANEAPLKKAWYGKAVQAMNMLNRIGKNDSDIQAVLSQYSGLIRTEKKKMSYTAKVLIGLVIAFIVMGVIGSRQIKGDNESHERVEQLLQQGDFQGARSAAKYQSERDMISTSEVLFLISEGNFRQAKIVTATIEDENKRKEMQKAIAEAETEAKANNNP